MIYIKEILYRAILDVNLSDKFSTALCGTAFISPCLDLGVESLSGGLINAAADLVALMSLAAQGQLDGAAEVVFKLPLTKLYNIMFMEKNGNLG